jgi:hypothetical protein
MPTPVRGRDQSAAVRDLLDRHLVERPGRHGLVPGPLLRPGDRPRRAARLPLVQREEEQPVNAWQGGLVFLGVAAFLTSAVLWVLRGAVRRGRR